MNHLHVLLLTLLPALVVASTSSITDCLPGAVNNGKGAGIEANFAKLKQMGELAFVGRDPTSAEAGFTCFVLNLKADLTYDLRYKDGNGAKVTVNGTYQDKRDTVPILNNVNAFAQLENLPSELLNRGSLHPIVFVQDEVIFQTCYREVFTGIRSTYVAVPLAKAKANSANSGCGGCDDWSSV